jgi:hypothetical protein
MLCFWLIDDSFEFRKSQGCCTIYIMFNVFSCSVSEHTAYVLSNVDSIGGISKF